MASPDAPGEPRQVRTSFTLKSADPDSTTNGMFVILDEDPDARGQFAGTIVFAHESGFMEIKPTEATMDSKRVLHLPAGAVEESFEFSFEWDAIELRLEDQDGDGVLESGTGHLDGAVMGTLTPDYDFTAGHGQGIA